MVEIKVFSEADFIFNYVLVNNEYRCCFCGTMCCFLFVMPSKSKFELKGKVSDTKYKRFQEL